jgi:P4 family phage/plasmid primase-like protien
MSTSNICSAFWHEDQYKKLTDDEREKVSLEYIHRTNELVVETGESWYDPHDPPISFYTGKPVTPEEFAAMAYNHRLARKNVDVPDKTPEVPDAPIPAASPCDTRDNILGCPEGLSLAEKIKWMNEQFSGSAPADEDEYAPPCEGSIDKGEPETEADMRQNQIRGLAALPLAEFAVELPEAAKKLGIGRTDLRKAVEQLRREIAARERDEKRRAARDVFASELEIGSDVEIAKMVNQDMRIALGEIVYSEGKFWHYADTAWVGVDETDMRKRVHSYDGAYYGQDSRVRLTEPKINSIINEMGVLLYQRDFFATAAPGINCATGFIRFESDGTPRLVPHDPDHRCRHTLTAHWQSGMAEQPPEGTLLHTFLTGLFDEDEEADQKRALLQELAGSAVAGLATKTKQPKAAVLHGRHANNGKSTYLELVRGLLPTSACSSVTPGNFSDQHYRVGLVGRLLNTSDELSSATAIASDQFKAIVTGNPIEARDLYKPVVSFRPMAQHIFATNRLPPFVGSMDRGVQRRLLVLKFEKSIPPDKMIELIADRILDEEPDLLLAWAVAGAARLIRHGGFTVPPSSIAALQEWLRNTDPVKAWTVARVRPGETPEVVNHDGYQKPDIYKGFNYWAEQNGYRKDRLPGLPEFFNRLAEDYPCVLKRRNDSRRIRGITILPSDDEGDGDAKPSHGADKPADGYTKINAFVETYGQAAAAGLHRKPGSSAWVDETGREVWGDELDDALRKPVLH